MATGGQSPGPGRHFPVGQELGAVLLGLPGDEGFPVFPRGGARGLEVQEPPVVAVEGQKVDMTPRRMAPGWGWSSRSHSLAAQGVSGARREVRKGSAGRPRVRPEFPPPGSRPPARQALLPEGGGQGDRIRPRVTPGEGLKRPVRDHSPEPGRVAIGRRFGFRPGGVSGGRPPGRRGN